MMMFWFVSGSGPAVSQKWSPGQRVMWSGFQLNQLFRNETIMKISCFSELHPAQLLPVKGRPLILSLSKPREELYIFISKLKQLRISTVFEFQIL